MRLQTLALMTLAALPALAQMQDNREFSLKCDDRNRSGDRNLASHCEIREQTMPAVSQLTVDGATNGGISVKGWTRGDILVRAKIDTSAPTEQEAAGMVSQIHVGTGTSVRADGPDFGRDHNWSVSYEVFVPQNTSLNLKAHNGGIAISDLRGNIDFDGVNGGVALKRLAGTVHGQTKNGGLAIEMMGDRWDGTEFDAKTTNGGVAMTLPANYSAHLETSTVNGHIAHDFPVTARGNIGRQLSVDVGSGGPLVRVSTTNGGVAIKRKS